MPKFHLHLLLGLSLLVLLSPGCKKQTAPQTALNPDGRSGPVSVQTNSFSQVARHLDPGGSFYLYLDTEQFLKGLSGQVGELRSVVSSLPDMSASDRANVARLFDVVTGLIKSSGLEEVSAVGASGVQVQKDMFFNKLMLHHYPGNNQGLLWSMFGTAPHPLKALDYLPENTALAMFSDLDVPLFWKTLKDQIQQANIPELSKAIEQFSFAVASPQGPIGMDLDKLLASLGGEVGILLTLDPSRSMTLPRPRGPKIEMPEPALALMIKVKDDVLFKKLDGLIAKNPQSSQRDSDGLKMRTLHVPAPLPLRPSVGYSGDYLFLGTTDEIITELVAVKNGKSKGLKSNPEFKSKSKGIPLEGNAFAYVSPEISRTINHIISSLADAEAASGRLDSPVAFVERLVGDKETFSFSVASNTKEGWLLQGNSSSHPVAALVGPAMIAPAAVVAGMALPAMAKAKTRAQSVNCMNNLKQIGLAAQMFAADHGGVLPKDFESIKADLNSPKILICPGDAKKTAPGTWAGFNFSNASYEIVSPGASAKDDPQKVFLRCPIHGTICRVDGSVQLTPIRQGATRLPRTRR